jgi:hypothetical protein
LFFSWEVWPQEQVCLERRNAEIRFLLSNSSAKPEPAAREAYPPELLQQVCCPSLMDLSRKLKTERA